ncbi:hypothetical protein [Rhizobium leucaenae]|jgi:hypothetical protein|uniref:Uncharacterized protein n=1 Tax=Rhizobium leucaenae TaxID=29450 RepID=A0A7W6ZQE6_9HYPH|nr:hypothetical protein [Rhizobium leucaenae]MBB4566814.1 hypothetical protein [Rhizobium leucaenae]MBB6300622.1 hypothetical protein [Rhizobium leucaenae]
METYRRYRKDAAPPGSIVIKFYHSGDQIRGFIRKVARPGEDDAIFPGEEMEPDDAFRAARNKMTGGESPPIYVELSEGVRWDPAWGMLQ